MTNKGFRYSPTQPGRERERERDVGRAVDPFVGGSFRLTSGEVFKVLEGVDPFVEGVHAERLITHTLKFRRDFLISFQNLRKMLKIFSLVPSVLENVCFFPWTGGALKINSLARVCMWHTLKKNYAKRANNGFFSWFSIEHCASFVKNCSAFPARAFSARESLFYLLKDGGEKSRNVNVHESASSVP